MSSPTGAPLAAETGRSIEPRHRHDGFDGLGAP